jgi:hypothetical protein
VRKPPFFEATKRYGVKPFTIHSGMQVAIEEPDVSPLQLHGPKPPDVAKALLGDWALDLAC